MFLKVSQISLEKNLCRNLFLIKLQAIFKNICEGMQRNERISKSKIELWKCEGMRVTGKNLTFKVKTQLLVGVLQKRCVLKISGNFTGNACFGFFFNKVVGPQVFNKNRLQRKWFSCKTCETFKNTFFNRKSLVAASENLYNTY